MPRPKPAARPRTIPLRVDPALARAWKKSLALLTAATRDGMHAFDHKYEIVGDILDHDPPLYLAAGLATAKDFLARYLPGEDERTVTRNVRVARYASPAEEERYGTSKLDAAIDYLEAKHGRPAHGRIPVDFERLRIDGAGAARGSLRFADATVQQLRAATRALSRNGGSAKPLSLRRNPAVGEVARHLPAGAKDVTVHYADGRLSLGRIPVRLFVPVMRALAKAKVPVAGA